MAAHCWDSSWPEQICVFVDPPNVEVRGSPASVTAGGVLPLLNSVPVAGANVWFGPSSQAVMASGISRVEKSTDLRIERSCMSLG
jgi:hypothetical protein